MDKVRIVKVTMSFASSGTAVVAADHLRAQGYDANAQGIRVHVSGGDNVLALNGRTEFADLGLAEWPVKVSGRFRFAVPRPPRKRQPRPTRAEIEAGLALLRAQKALLLNGL